MRIFSSLQFRTWLITVGIEREQVDVYGECGSDKTIRNEVFQF